MFDLFIHAWRHPMDYIHAFKTRRIIFKEKIAEGDNIYTFVFTMIKPFSWKAGQHGIFNFPTRHIKGRNWRPFSIASSAHEGVIKIGTIIPPEPSDFKHNLANLKPGDAILLNGPFGEFHAPARRRHIVGIAGGIGITPFRAIAYEIAHGHLPKTSLTLIDSAITNHVYKTELDSWQSDKLKIIYTHTPEEVQQAINQQYELHGNKADYYISGSPGMIGALRKQCQNLKIKNIINDPFKGY